MHPIYLRYEMLRNVRSRRFVVFSLAYSVVLYFIVAWPQRHAHVRWYLVPAVLHDRNGGPGNDDRGHLERRANRRRPSAGWTRQLRHHAADRHRVPRPRSLRLPDGVARVVLVYLAGASLGVSCRPSQWSEMTGLLLVGLIPFAVFGIRRSSAHADSRAPAVGGTSCSSRCSAALTGSVARRACSLSFKVLPSYWLVQAGKSALPGGRLAGRGVDRRGGLDCGTGAVGRAGVPARHGPGVSRPRIAPVAGRDMNSDLGVESGRGEWVATSAGGRRGGAASCCPGRSWSTWCYVSSRVASNRTRLALSSAT